MHVHAAAADHYDKACKLKLAICLGDGAVVDLRLGRKASDAGQLLAGSEISRADKIGDAVSQLHPNGQVGGIVDLEDSIFFHGGQGGIQSI